MTQYSLEILKVIGMTQPVIVRYVSEDKMVEIPCYFSRGLEGAYVPGVSKDVLSFLCVEPFWQEPEWTSYYTSDLYTSFYSTYIAGLVDGNWMNLNAPSQYPDGDEQIFAILVASDGNVWVGGAFEDWAGVPNADYIAVWDGSDWNEVGGGLNGEVYEIVEAPDGMIYIAGTFSNAGGDPKATKIARWNGSSWESVGDPTGNGTATLYYGQPMLFASDGNLYFGGWFYNLGGDPNAVNFAKWDGTNWSAVSSYVPDKGLIRLAEMPNKDIVVAGRFTKIANDPDLGYIAIWDGNTWQALSSVGRNPNIVYALYVDAQGRIYINDDSGVVRWSGTTWELLGGANGPRGEVGVVEDIRGLPNGEIIVAGGFTELNQAPVSSGFAIWDGSAWRSLDITLPSSPPVTYAHGYTVGIGPKKGNEDFDLYLSYGSSGTTYAGNKISLQNPGSAPAYPIIKISRLGGTSAKIKDIVNLETLQRLNLELDILDGETITIDLRPWKKTVVSDYRGNLLGKLNSLSDLTTWSLIPGENRIRIYVEASGNPSLDATFSWRNAYWSIDDVG